MSKKALVSNVVDQCLLQSKICSLAKAYIKARENPITGNKQKLVMFYTQLGIIYNALKKEQEEEEK